MGEVQTAGKGKNGLILLLSTVALVALLILSPEWVWLSFPFFFTYLVLTFDAM